MRLTSQQTQVLTTKIVEEIKVAIITPESELSKLEDKVVRNIIKSNKLMLEMYSGTNYNHKYNIKNFFRAKYPEKFEKVQSLRNDNVKLNNLNNKVRDEIILRTIDCTNLEELIKEIKNKFINAK